MTAAEWTIFVAYRRLLARCEVEDDAGFALWASRAMQDGAVPPVIARAELTILEPADSPEINRAIEAMHREADALTIALVADPEAGSCRFNGTARHRETWGSWGFEEVHVPPCPGLPPGPALLVNTLFADPDAEPSGDIAGLDFRFAPAGDGQALAVARRVRDLLDGGVDPEEIAVVVPRPGETSARIVATLATWGIPASEDRPEAMRSDPAVAALLEAMRLPVGGWDADRVVALLRNGRFRPRWEGLEPPLAAASAATAIRESGVYRDASAIRTALKRAAAIRDGDDAERTRIRGLARSRAGVALPIFDLLVATIEAVALAGDWASQVARVDLLARDLGIGPAPGPEALTSALEDHGEILRRLGRENQVWSWAAFVEEAGGLIRDLDLPPSPPPPRAIRVLSPESVPGAGVAHAILADLGEGTYPSRSALDAARAGDPGGLEAALGREQERFLGLVGMAREGLTLIAPHADEKGHPLLSAGFLDDVERRFTRSAREDVSRTIDRVGPVLPDDLAVAATEARVRAVGLACREDDFSGLSAMARHPAHRKSLDGTALALRLAHWRSRRGRFGRYDGRLEDPRIAAKLAEMYGSTRSPFSASQLESLAKCPFQFFQRYVLKLDPPEDRPEMQEDSARKGSLFHRALETLHARLRDMPAEGLDAESMSDLVSRGIGPTVDAILEGERTPDSEIARGLAAIQAGRIRRFGTRYARQFREYAEKTGRDAEARLFEVAFGRPGNPHPPLVLGGETGVAISGVIDRIDLVRREGSPRFRVIDYKTGKIEKKQDIDEGLALQLPLYAIAAQRLGLAAEGAEILDVAYWAIRGKGFQSAKAMTSDDAKAEKVREEWIAFSSALEDYLLELVARLRVGDLPLRPREADCTRTCDYRFSCRIHHARANPKEWVEAPRLERNS